MQLEDIIDSWHQSYATLRRAFYNEYDPSVALAWLERRYQAPGMHFLGEGGHFETFSLRTGGPLDLALKRATTGFWGPEDPRRAAWVRRLNRIRQLEVFGIPPFELIQSQGHLGVVMPCAQEKVAGDEAEVWKRAVEADAATHGLLISDVLQGGLWNRIPFLYDLSDLNGDR